MSNGALSDLTILELGEMVSAPYCAKLMADLGARVIKIEKPLGGDRSRSFGPFPEDTPHQERSGLFLYLNANKLGITVDVGDPDGQDILHRLVGKADVLVHNVAPERAIELALTYDSLKSFNTRIVVTSITPFGMTGPYRGFKAESFNICHFAGPASTVGVPEREPLALPENQSAYFAAISAAGATLCALVDRDLEGWGQDVDISEADVFAGLLMGLPTTLTYTTGQPPPRTGHRVSFTYPHGVFPCKDGYVALGIVEDDQWTRLVQVMGNPEWAQDGIFMTAFSRFTHADSMDDLIQPWLTEHTREEIFQVCQANRVPVTPVYDASDLVHHPHMSARSFFPEIEHAHAGSLKHPGAPYVFSQSPWAIVRGAPNLGEHNAAVYSEMLGMSDEDCQRLRARNVI